MNNSVDDNRELSIKYNISAIPAVMFFKDGKLLTFLDANSDKDYEYYSSREGLNKWIKSFVKIK